jgi:RNA polymerase sigma-70 factor, ECF subfamily
MTSSNRDEKFSNLLSDNGEEFFKYLFNKYYLELCKLAFKYVGRTEIAEDLVQDVFINIWNKKQDLSHIDKTKSYLTASVVNTSINFISSKFSRQNFVEESLLQNEASDSNQHHQMVNLELQQLIKLSIEQLPDKCRVIFTLSRYSAMSYKEIAEELNISVKTIETQISIALKKIREFLGRNGYLLLIFFNLIQ